MDTFQQAHSVFSETMAYRTSTKTRRDVRCLTYINNLINTNIMKLHYFFLILALGTLASCGDDCDDLSEVIVGTWSSAALGTGSFTFNSDGSVTDPGDVLFGFEANGIAFDQKSYTITGSTISLRAESELDQTQFGSLELTATEFDCETITVDAGAFSVTLDKQ